MFKKKLKNPIMTVRSPELINREYSEVVAKLGALVIEEETIAKNEAIQDERVGKIQQEKRELLDKVPELSDEMNASQENLRKKAAQEAKEKADASKVVSI